MQFLMDIAYILSGHKRDLTDAAWSPDGAKLATSSLDGTVRIWNSANGELLHELKGQENPSYFFIRLRHLKQSLMENRRYTDPRIPVHQLTR
jgi:WD40 repeat protein